MNADDVITSGWKSKKVHLSSIKLRFMKSSLVALLFCAGVVQAQSQAELATVMKPITQLFTGMNLGDSAMVHRSFAKQVTMSSIGQDKEGKLRVTHESSIDNFLKAVGTPRPEPLSEPIWDVKINIDGNLASVWASYALYVGKRFSHCGADAFHLVKEPNGEWKIFHLADSRRKDCTVPPSVSSMFN